MALPETLVREMVARGVSLVVTSGHKLFWRFCSGETRYGGLTEGPGLDS